MKYHEMRYRILCELFDRYRIVCIKNKLSVPKQTAEIIRQFVEVQEENIKIMENLKHGGK